MLSAVPPDARTFHDTAPRSTVGANWTGGTAGPAGVVSTGVVTTGAAATTGGWAAAGAVSTGTAGAGVVVSGAETAVVSVVESTTATRGVTVESGAASDPPSFPRRPKKAPPAARRTITAPITIPFLEPPDPAVSSDAITGRASSGASRGAETRGVEA